MDVRKELLADAMERAGLDPAQGPTAEEVMALPLSAAAGVAAWSSDPVIAEAMRWRQDALIDLRRRLVGARTDAARAMIFAAYKNERQQDQMTQSVIDAAIRDVESERGKRGRKPTGLTAASGSRRARRSRVAREGELYGALHYLLRRLSDADRAEWIERYPHAAKIAGLQPADDNSHAAEIATPAEPAAQVVTAPPKKIKGGLRIDGHDYVIDLDSVLRDGEKTPVCLSRRKKAGEKTYEWTTRLWRGDGPTAVHATRDEAIIAAAALAEQAAGA